MNTRKPTPPAQRALCLILAFLLSCSLFATGCAPQVNTPETQAPTEAPIPETTQTPTEKPAAEEYTLPLEDGYNQLTFYWNSPDGYENCDMWIWFPNQDGKGHVFQKCEYGGKVVIKRSRKCGRSRIYCSERLFRPRRILLGFCCKGL